MKIIQFNNEVAVQLEFLEFLAARSKLSKKDEQLLERLRAGKMGEEIVLNYMNTFGARNWKVLQNIWVDYNGTFECDLILFTSNAIRLFEIKNYDGKFHYKDGSCFLNGLPLSSNSLSQTLRATINLENIAKEVSFPGKIAGSLLFVGEHNEVEIASSTPAIDIVNRSQLKLFIHKIAFEEARDYRRFPIDPFIARLKKYKTANPFCPELLSPSEIQKLRKGIRCEHCGNFCLRIEKFYAYCRFGHIESRNKAVLRTVNEYRKFVNTDTFTRKEIEEFLDHQVSTKYLVNILSEHFTMVYKNKYTYYK